MMYQRNGAQQYHSVRSHGQIADASPARLVQIMLEHILSQLAVARGCMERIHGNLPLAEVITKGKAMGKALRLIGQLDATLDMDKGDRIAANLHNLYLYMLGTLTTANANNDPRLVVDVANLVQTIKVGWDKLVADGQ